MLLPSWFFFDRVGPIFKIQYKISSQDWMDAAHLMDSKFQLMDLFYNPDKTSWLFLNSLIERNCILKLNDQPHDDFKAVLSRHLETSFEKNMKFRIQMLDSQTKTFSKTVWSE